MDNFRLFIFLQSSWNIVVNSLAVSPKVVVALVKAAVVAEHKLVDLVPIFWGNYLFKFLLETCAPLSLKCPSHAPHGFLMKLAPHLSLTSKNDEKQK